jgi:hypothetical protein
VSDAAPGAIVFLVAFFLAIVGATLLVVAARKGLLDERRRTGER